VEAYKQPSSAYLTTPCRAHTFVPSRNQHYRAEHYPCNEPSCRARRFVVFPDALALQAHALRDHPHSRNTSRNVPLDFGGAPTEGGVVSHENQGEFAPDDIHSFPTLAGDHQNRPLPAPAGAPDTTPAPAPTPTPAPATALAVPDRSGAAVDAELACPPRRAGTMDMGAWAGTRLVDPSVRREEDFPTLMGSSGGGERGQNRRPPAYSSWVRPGDGCGGGGGDMSDGGYGGRLRAADLDEYRVGGEGAGAAAEEEQPTSLLPPPPPPPTAEDFPTPPVTEEPRAEKKKPKKKTRQAPAGGVAGYLNSIGAGKNRAVKSTPQKTGLTLVRPTKPAGF